MSTPKLSREAFVGLRALALDALADLAAAGAKVLGDQKPIVGDDGESILDAEGNPVLKEAKRFTPGDVLLRAPQHAKIPAVRRYLAARNKLVEANIGLVKSVAKRQNQDVVSFDDLVQAGHLGLIRAVELYDPERASFSTYATWWIRNGMQELTAVCKDQITSKYKEDLRAAHFYSKHGRMPSADELGCKPSDLTHEQTWRTFISLDDPVRSLNRNGRGRGGSERIVSELLPDTRNVDAEDHIDQEELFAALSEAIDELPDSERAVVMGMYYGTESHEALATRARVAKETVRKRSQRALARLRKKMRGWKDVVST